MTAEHQVGVRIGAVCVLDQAVLLVRHGPGPAGGEWSLPELSLQRGEAVAEAVVRACEELAGFEALCGPFMGWSERPGAEPHTVQLYFEAVPIDTDAAVQPPSGSGAAEARFVPTWEVPELRLAPDVAELLAEQGIIDAVV